MLASGVRKAVNLSLDTGVVAAAREAGLNLSQLCERVLRDESRKVLEQRWQAENSATIDGINAWIDEHGIPLADLDPL